MLESVRANSPRYRGQRDQGPGLILIQIPGFDDDEVVHALAYGMGFQLLEPGNTDNLFGQRIAIRTASQGALRSLTVTTMDERSRTSRSTIASR